MNKWLNKKVTMGNLRKDTSKSNRDRKLSDTLWGFDTSGFETVWRSIRDGSSVVPYFFVLCHLMTAVSINCALQGPSLETCS